MGYAGDKLGTQAAKLASVTAIHGDRILKSLAARAKIHRTYARAVERGDMRRMGLSLLMDKLEGIPYRPPAKGLQTPGVQESESAVQGELDAEVQKVLAIMAVMINQTQAEIAGMTEILETIQAMDGVFFDTPEERKRLGVVSLKDEGGHGVHLSEAKEKHV